MSVCAYIRERIQPGNTAITNDQLQHNMAEPHNIKWGNGRDSLVIDSSSIIVTSDPFATSGRKHFRHFIEDNDKYERKNLPSSIMLVYKGDSVVLQEAFDVRYFAHRSKFLFPKDDIESCPSITYPFSPIHIAIWKFLCPRIRDHIS